MISLRPIKKGCVNMPEQLHKSRTNKVFAGVCGGLADYFKVDATLIRLAWALAFFFGGTGLILYILAMIIMPEDPSSKSQEIKNDEDTITETEEKEKKELPVVDAEEKKHQIFGLILVGLGGYFLVEKFFPLFHFQNWWPIILILIGIFILFKNKK